VTTAHRSADGATREQAQELIRSWDSRPTAGASTLGSLLGRVTPVDQVGVEERVDSLRRRSIKRASKLWALDLAVRMMDLTTLEGKDTPGKIRALAAKAMRPQPGDPTIPSVAALCVYPALVPEAKDALSGSRMRVASVAIGFPSGQTFRDIKIVETRAATEAGGWHPHGEGGEPVARGRVRDPRAAMDDARSLPLRRELPPQRRHPPDRQGAHRPLRRSRRRHPRLMPRGASRRSTRCAPGNIHGSPGVPRS